MVNLPIVGNLPITAEGFPIVAKGFPGRADGFPGSWIAPVFALASIGFLPIITLQCLLHIPSSTRTIRFAGTFPPTALQFMGNSE